VLDDVLIGVAHGRHLPRESTAAARRPSLCATVVGIG
jgi:hypothetical protein